MPSAAAVRDLAYHWFHATQPVDVSKAIEYSKRAAGGRLEALAPDEALRYYGQALQLHAQLVQPDPVLGVDLRIGLGTAQRQVGAGEYRTTLLEAGAEAERCAPRTASSAPRWPTVVASSAPLAASITSGSGSSSGLSTRSARSVAPPGPDFWPCSLRSSGTRR